MGCWRIVRTDRWVETDAFGELTVLALAGALVAAEAAELQLRPRKGLLKTYEVAHLRLLPGVKPSRFPHRSPEARVIEWLARQEGREGWLDEAIIATLIPEESTAADLMWAFELHRGLVARKLARETERTVFLLFTTMVHQLEPQAQQALDAATDADVEAALACRARLTADERLRCRQAWDHARHMRYYDSSS